MSTVTFDRVSLIYPGAERASVEDFSLEIADGEFMVLVGPSGCGKSTTLRMLAGLEQVSSGSVFIDGDDVTESDPRDRDIAMVFQNYALYPHLSVRDNMAFALSLAKRPKAEITERVNQAAELLGLTEFLDRKPKALSGGQRQRVAMGRAIVREPRVFCMDEPLSNLDAKMRVKTRAEIARLQDALGTTTLYVTHDQVEAMTMGDRVAVMNLGRLQQVAPPRELYNRPANLFVAGFIGSPAMNLIEAQTDADGTVHFGDLHLPVPEGSPREITVGIRPEHLRLHAPGTTEAGLELEVDMVEELGSDAYVYGRTMIDGHEIPMTVRIDWNAPPAIGDRVRLDTKAERVHVFATETGERIDVDAAIDAGAAAAASRYTSP